MSEWQAICLIIGIVFMALLLGAALGDALNTWVFPWWFA